MLNLNFYECVLFINQNVIKKTFTFVNAKNKSLLSLSVGYYRQVWVVVW